MKVTRKEFERAVAGAEEDLALLQLALPALVGRLREAAELIDRYYDERSDRWQDSDPGQQVRLQLDKIEQSAEAAAIAAGMDPHGYNLHRTFR